MSKANIQSGMDSALGECKRCHVCLKHLGCQKPTFDQVSTQPQVNARDAMSAVSLALCLRGECAAKIHQLTHNDRGTKSEGACCQYGERWKLC